jgi:hypothetical protein
VFSSRPWNETLDGAGKRSSLLQSSCVHPSSQRQTPLLHTPFNEHWFMQLDVPLVLPAAAVLGEFSPVAHGSAYSIPAACMICLASCGGSLIENWVVLTMVMLVPWFSITLVVVYVSSNTWSFTDAVHTCAH